MSSYKNEYEKYLQEQQDMQEYYSQFNRQVPDFCSEDYIDYFSYTEDDRELDFILL